MTMPLGIRSGSFDADEGEDVDDDDDEVEEEEELEAPATTSGTQLLVTSFGCQDGTDFFTMTLQCG